MDNARRVLYMIFGRATHLTLVCVLERARLTEKNRDLFQNKSHKIKCNLSIFMEGMEKLLTNQENIAWPAFNIFNLKVLSFSSGSPRRASGS